MSYAAQDGRVAWVDYAKGFCIVMVVMMHSTLGVGDAMGREGFLHAVVAFAKPFRMPDFFMIAGLFLAQTIGRDWRTFIDRKVVHFAYFYLLWMVIQCVLKDALMNQQGLGETARQLAFGLIEPFGTLWFIYLLPIFFVTTKLLRPAPAILVWLAAALLETMRVQTDWTAIDEFAARYVYFITGYLLAPKIFMLAKWAGSNKGKASAGLLVWALAEGVLVFAPNPFDPRMEYASLPFVSLVAGYAGACAVIVGASLIAGLRFTGWLRYCGRNSIVIYLAFFLPMAATRMTLVRFNLISDVGLASVIVTLVGVSIPVVLYRLVRQTRFRFLFERPAIFRLASHREQVRLQPAE